MDLIVALYLLSALLIFLSLYICFSDSHPSPVGRRLESDSCAVCLEEIRHEAQPCCGHVFCEVWEKRYRPSKVPCPMCRAEVSLILANFPQDSAESKVLWTRLDDYNVRFSTSARSLWRAILDTPFLIKRVLIDLMNPETFCRALVYACALAAIVVYVLVPDDLFPEGELGPIGLADDLGSVVVGGVLISLRYFIRLQRESAVRLANSS